MAKLVPLLYHVGNAVTVRTFGRVVSVIYTVKIGEEYQCPHCGKTIKLRATAGSHYAYYLDVPHPNAPCCTPFQHFDLQSYHDVNYHTFASFMQSL